ncbi:MAG: hypothetical protein J6X99_03880 [Bacteroidales bacterium]|nr:hypothetical protein [Bacteroidales bacterium]
MASCLLLPTACVNDDLSWKQELEAQKKELTEQQKELDGQQKTIDGLAYEPFDNKKPEEGELILYTTPKTGDKYQTEEIRTVIVNASEVDGTFTPLTVRFKIVVNLTIK